MRDISITSTTIPSKNSRVETQNETKDYSWLAIFKLTPQKFPNLHASLITEHGDHTKNRLQIQSGTCFTLKLSHKKIGSWISTAKQKMFISNSTRKFLVKGNERILHFIKKTSLISRQVQRVSFSPLIFDFGSLLNILRQKFKPRYYLWLGY